MTTKACTVLRIDNNTTSFAWAGLANGDDGTPIPDNWADYADRTVHVSGTPGVGGNLRIEGSNESGMTQAAALNDAFGVALNIASVPSVKAITEVPLSTRPRVTAGDGDTSLNVTIIARRAKGV